MSRKTSETVFRHSKATPDECGNVAWEDDALIKAYDTAVSSLQNFDLHTSSYQSSPPYDASATMSNDTGYLVWSRTPKVEIQHYADDIEQNEEYDQENDETWSVGDECMAYFYEDGLYYPAVVQSVDYDDGTATVEYADYNGGPEAVQLEDIHQRRLWNLSEVESNLSETTQSCSSSVGNNADDERQKKENKPRLKTSHYNHKQFVPKPFNLMPPSPWMLPPDLNTSTNDVNSLSKDALSNMFASWYMAGYQTGFHRGLASSCCKNNCKK
ncbi:survival motor neuron protein-like [Ciona intestinalis]